MLWYKVKRWRFWSKTILLSFFAAGTYSFNYVPNSDTFAPSAISFILELENDGMEGEITILTYLLVSWVIFILLSVAVRQMLKAMSKTTADPISNAATKLAEAKKNVETPPSSNTNEPNRTEPSLND
jgi:hypothetical protein